MKIIFRLSIVLCITYYCSSEVNAQHCQYDFWRLIGMVAYTGDSSNIVNNLQISHVDSAGKPIYKTKERYTNAGKLKKKQTGKKYTFWSNPKPNKDVNHYKRNKKKRHFPFAQNHYILVEHSVILANKNYFIKIEDIDGEANGGKFVTQIIKLEEQHIMRLCQKYIDKNTIDNYHPIYIKLTIK